MTPRPDPVRAQLEFLRGDLETRIAAATSALVRFMVGGNDWRGESVKTERAKLTTAIADRSIVVLAIAELNAVDGVQQP